MKPAGPPKAKANRSPTLYLIIAIKLLKGLVLVAVGIGFLSLIGHDLDARLDEFLRWIHLDPERRFFADLGKKLQAISPSSMRSMGVGTILYSIFSLVEGVGLVFRLRWIAWVVIGESLFFIPIEVYDLVLGFSRIVLGILALNIFIVWYLLRNKGRLFKHH